MIGSSMIFHTLYDKDLLQCPYWMPSNLQMLVMTGSRAYGIEREESDFDYIGMCIPPREMLFPNEYGYISGYDTLPEFESWVQHHVIFDQTEYGFNVLGICHYFKLLTKNNPNIIDSLFSPQNCYTFCTQAAQMIRDNRHIFLHKGLWHSFKNYAYSQKSKMLTKQTKSRQHLIEENGYDTKYALNLVRLLSECEQLLIEGDLDLQEKGRRAHLKAIRDGQVKLDDIFDYFSTKEKQLEKLFANTKLTDQPDISKIRSLLINCLEHHYGRITRLHQNVTEQAIKDIKEILVKHNL